MKTGFIGKKVEEVFRLKNKEMTKEEHKKMKRLDEELRERRNIIEVKKVVRLRGWFKQRTQRFYPNS